MKIRANLVLIRVDQPKDRETPNGPFVQEEWKQLPPTGVVEAVGEAITFAKAGDRVEFERFSAITPSWDKNLRLCRDEAILAVLDA